MSRRKQNKVTKNLVRIVLTVVVLCAVAAYTKFNGQSDVLPSEVNGAGKAEVSVSRNPQADADPVTEQVSPNEMEAPEEGLSRKSYEDLEQPAPIAGKQEVILFKSQHIVSFNSETLCPNYVCWRLTRERLEGNSKRSDVFKGDPVLNGELRVETTDYSGSGYDRGHMCPAGDNKNSEKGMQESFFMTNICPQSHNLNSGDWKELEEICREWTRDYGDLYICCGPIFDTDNPKRIGNRKDVKIAVPDRFFKVVLALGRSPKAIGFIYPNATTNQEMRSYAVSVDEVESITGIDFYPQLPDEQEADLESKCNPAAWGI